MKASIAAIASLALLASLGLPNVVAAADKSPLVGRWKLDRKATLARLREEAANPTSDKPTSDKPVSERKEKKEQEETPLKEQLAAQDADQDLKGESAAADDSSLLPPFELTLDINADGKAVSHVSIDGIPQRKNAIWKVIEEQPDGTTVLEFLPTRGLPRKHTFQLLDDGKLVFQAQGAKHALVLERVQEESPKTTT